MEQVFSSLKTKKCIEMQSTNDDSTFTLLTFIKRIQWKDFTNPFLIENYYLNAALYLKVFPLSRYSSFVYNSRKNTFHKSITDKIKSIEAFFKRFGLLFLKKNDIQVVIMFIIRIKLWESSLWLRSIWYSWEILPRNGYYSFASHVG